MPRPKRPVILKKDGISKRFDSITAAAAFLGVKTPSVFQVLNVRERHHTIHGFSVEYDAQSAQPRPLIVYSAKCYTKYVGLEVVINGETYRSEYKPDKASCTECDIYKAEPPKSMFGAPLCYDHSLGNRRVYSYCESNHCLVWKLKKNRIVMTKEEAIKVLSESIHDGSRVPWDKTVEAVHLSIEAISQPSPPTIKGWVARDSVEDDFNGCGLILHYKKPWRTGGEWSNQTIAMHLPWNMFPGLKWEDEPIEVELIVRPL